MQAKFIQLHFKSPDQEFECILLIINEVFELSPLD